MGVSRAASRMLVTVNAQRQQQQQQQHRRLRRRQQQRQGKVSQNSDGQTAGVAVADDLDDFVRRHFRAIVRCIRCSDVATSASKLLARFVHSCFLRIAPCSTRSVY